MYFKRAGVYLVILVLLFFNECSCLLGQTVKPSPYAVSETVDIGRVPAGFPVRFCLLTDGDQQYAAYYDQDHRMTVASRMLDSDKWTYKVLDTKVGWDSHNYITMAVDRDGHLHVSGNMHCVKLIYFRTEKPGDITTLKRHAMTGEAENRVTYPKFFRNHKDELLFSYRDGGSGNGRQIWNKYESDTRTWSRLLDKPLFDGEGKRNAYFRGPVRGPDGYFHIIWVWRDTPDCATNNNLSYARSKDLINWETASGKKIKLPMVLANRSLIVDPIPSGGGAINGGQSLFFDMKKRPVIAYHKSGSNGNMQIYTARFEGGKWVIRQLTQWNKPVKFSGYGSMGFIGIRIGRLKRAEPGVLTITYRHKDYGSGRLVINENTLEPIDKKVTIVRDYPKEMNRRQIKQKGFGIRRSGDIGSSEDENVKYVLQWETMGRNHDRPRKEVKPKSSMLELFKLVQKRVY